MHIESLHEPKINYRRNFGNKTCFYFSILIWIFYCEFSHPGRLVYTRHTILNLWLSTENRPGISNCLVTIRIRLGRGPHHHCPLLARRLNGAVHQMRPPPPPTQRHSRCCTIKVTPYVKGKKRLIWPKIFSPSPAMMASPQRLVSYISHIFLLTVRRDDPYEW